MGKKRQILVKQGGKKEKSFLEKRSTTRMKDWNKGKPVINSKRRNVRTPQPSTTQHLIEGLTSVEKRHETYDRTLMDTDNKDENTLKTNVNREADNTRRNFYKELKKLLTAADIVVQVLDARDPMSCRSMALEREILANNKKLILVLNKIDLIPINICEEWLRILKKDFPTIAFKASRNNAVRSQHSESNLQGAYDSGVLHSQSGVVGAGDLLQLIKNYSRTRGGSYSSVAVGIVGYPNVGKSSLINSMKRTCVVKVGGTAGITRTIQEVHLDSKVRLIDCPGVVFAGKSDDPSVVLRSAVKVENLEDPVGVLRGLITRFPVADVENHWGITLKQGVDFFLTKFAHARGKLKRGGAVDHAAAARVVLLDMMTGKFRYYVLPPIQRDADKIQVVQQAAQEFDINNAMEITVLKPDSVKKQKPKELTYGVDAVPMDED